MSTMQHGDKRYGSEASEMIFPPLAYPEGPEIALGGNHVLLSYK